jgi:hypothetical protein
MDNLFWPILIPITAIIGGITYAIVKAVSIGRIRELEVRERIAMIERGLVPPPEADPRGFDRAMRRYDRHFDRDRDFYRKSPERHQSAGITLIGVGIGLAFLIAFTGEDDVRNAIGVGGFLVIMGIFFLINSLMSRRGDDRVDRPVPPASSSSGIPPSGQGPLQPGA